MNTNTTVLFKVISILVLVLAFGHNIRSQTITLSFSQDVEVCSDGAFFDVSI